MIYDGWSALVVTFDELYEKSGNAEAYGSAKVLCTYKVVASLYHIIKKMPREASRLYKVLFIKG